jgi:hypothetical protein
MKTTLSRRQFLRALAGVGVAGAVAPFVGMPRAWGLDGQARRLIVFYFPDGVPGRSADGEASLWHPTGGLRDFALPDVLSGLQPWRDECVFLNGLSMGPTDSGIHPGGAKKLLTATDGGNSESIDQLLARTVGGAFPHRHVYLGVQANQNSASGDKHISYLAPGTTLRPEDHPLRAFERLFSGAAPVTPTPGGVSRDAERSRVLDLALEDLNSLRSSLGPAERARLDVHAESIRELERRLSTDTGGGTPPPADCENPALELTSFDERRIHDPELFPAQMRDQIDVMVTAMSCGLSRVGVLQASQHTSELIMSRFADSELYDPGFDMRSHQASHYGPRHDESRREFREYVAQRRWFVEQFAYLLSELARRPEGDGTMLDYSSVLLCTEVSDGNTHLHDDMPFVLAGRAGGAIDTGRLLNFGGDRHAGLLCGIARAQGSDLARFGDTSSGPLSGLVAG